ncbi:MAG TPA: hypothetical protein VFM54_02345 [Micromonosporaceae bacterium]|nr:hypothetical protein [Micromonosporaceae bacterium]
MSRVRELLERFRPAGAPGAASGAGVPADRRAGVEAELEPVFAALDEAQRECARIREDAAVRAAARRVEVAERARAIVARARAGTPAERAAAAAETRRRGQHEIASIISHAEDDAEVVRRSAQRRQADLVARVVDTVRAQLAGAPVAHAPASHAPASHAPAPHEPVSHEPAAGERAGAARR